jgi:cytochrome c oxidase assembly protein Cox11
VGAGVGAGLWAGWVFVAASLALAYFSIPLVNQLCRHGPYLAHLPSAAKNNNNDDLDESYYERAAPSLS